LLKQFDGKGRNQYSEHIDGAVITQEDAAGPKMTASKQNGGTVNLISQKDAAEQAGLSERPF
jgi:hypothetical protein